MKEKWNFILYLVWFSYLVISAVVLFAQGFLLSRKTLNDISDCVPLSRFGCDGRENSTSFNFCGEEEKIRRVISNPGSNIVCSPLKNRVVFLLVDALRYDFTQYDPTLADPLPYQNKLPIMSELLKQQPDSTKLFKFMADPPTTTFQRVKSLATGSLPTFIDFTSNFAAEEIQEDNVVAQVTKGGGKVVLLGDDTWSRLMPGQWLRSHALYSFHTWDLDTVDNEIDKKIYDELHKNDWDLLVAHYLGVDHAGHRYGPNHPEMTRKLQETNLRLTKVIEELPPDVLLYVVGDHGMTELGDHGGESSLERTAAFFAYRKKGLAADYIPNGYEVQQTDFAPTLSAALGRPPPAPSLGNVLLSVLPMNSVPYRLLHLSNNLKQICHYLVRYGEESQQVSLEKLTQMINLTRIQINNAAHVRTKEDLEKYVKEVRSVVDEVRAVFREVWVEFDSLSMMRALLLLVLAIFANGLITEGVPMNRIPTIFASSFIPVFLMSNGLCIAICYTIYFFQVINNIVPAIILSTGLISGFLTGTLVIMHWDGISQRWYEGRSKFYERFARVALFASAAILVSNSYVIEEGTSLNFLAMSVLILIAKQIGTARAYSLLICCGIVLALTRNYRGCREEQGDCWTAGEGQPTGQASRAALVITLCSVAAVVASARRHLGWRGHGVVLSGLLACAHWAVGWGSLGSIYRSRMMARFAWLALATMFVLLWKREPHGAIIPLCVCSLLIFVGNTLALGVSYAPAAVLALSAGFVALHLVSSLQSDPAKDGKKGEVANKFCILTRCNSSVACAWALLACYQFYGTGHHATLGHVRWAPAFHAGDPNYTPLGAVVTTSLVFLDLFGMPLMFGAAVPLLALWGQNGASSVGPRTQLAAVFTLCLKFSLCFAIRVLVCALSATIHCRHLMIWGVFAPKLLFEAGMCTVALLGTILGATLTAWHLPTQHYRTS